MATEHYTTAAIIGIIAGVCGLLLRLYFCGRRAAPASATVPAAAPRPVREGDRLLVPSGVN